MAGNSGGPWGGDQGGGDDDDRRNNGDGNRPGPGGPQIPEIEQLMKKGQDQLRVLMGGRGGGGGNRDGGGGDGPGFGKGTILLGVVVAAVLWGMASFYRVDTSEESVELMFGKYLETGSEGLNFAPWPIVTREIVAVTEQNIEDIGVGRGSLGGEGLMLTGDENIVDIDFQVVWNINDLEKYLFNLAEPRETVRAVSESVMREIVARTDLTPILTTGKGDIAGELQTLIQETLDSYESGVQIVVVNLDKADPPRSVADSFRDVQAAEQTRDTLEKQADAYANKVVAGARGEAAQMIAQAQGYSARVVNEAEGEASRFTAVLTEYSKAPEVTRKRLYLETMEEVLGGINKIIMDQQPGAQGVVPYLPLNELRNNSQGGQ
ncbi:HflK protein [hydrothermal vent metagenome]|uniref:HflK protein n=1 Tax=hydrothermal vent metagenome TaxID=652676 RepID=A0A3B0T7W0_9ZZZZ